MKKSILLPFLLLCSLAASAQFSVPVRETRYSDQPDFHKKLSFSGYKQSALLDDYDVNFYFLDLKLERNSIYVEGHVTVTAEAVATLDTFALELIDVMTVDSVFINGTLRPFQHTGDHIYIPLASPVNAGNPVTAIVFYHGTPVIPGGFFSGISTDTSPSWGNEVTWTLSEPFSANQWWPCKQVLTDKADSSWVFITTDSLNKAGSNGILTATVPVAGGKKRYEWKSRNPIDYYLISAAVAKYVDYSIYAHPAGTTDSLLIQNYVYNNPATLPNFTTEINLTDDFIELYSDLFGLYPFMNEKYGHCMAPLGGGMEHQTMTTLGYFDFYLICHELAHMWFGDNVTCATWSDIFINEGFASYAEYLAAQYADSYAEAQNHMYDVHTNVMSVNDGSIYIPPTDVNDPERIFDGRLSYDKGSAVIHMLRFEMQNDSLFFNTLRHFQQEFAGSTATGDDFRNVAEEVSGLSLADFFDQWYYGEGFPTYQILWYQTSDSLYFTSTQSVSAPAITPLFKMLMEMKLNYNGGDTTIRWYQNAAVTTVKIPFNKSITSLQLDPENWVLDGPASIALSVEETAAPAYFTLMPNPAKQDLWINLNHIPAPDAMIFISDMAGRQLMEVPAQQQNRIDISVLQNGIYFLTLQNGTDRQIRKFIKGE